jgi:hypothetical protein
MNGDENSVNGRFIVFHADFIDFRSQKLLH